MVHNLKDDDSIGCAGISPEDSLSGFISDSFWRRNFFVEFACPRLYSVHEPLTLLTTIFIIPELSIDVYKYPGTSVLYLCAILTNESSIYFRQSTTTHSIDVYLATRRRKSSNILANDVGDDTR